MEIRGKIVQILHEKNIFALSELIMAKSYEDKQEIGQGIKWFCSIDLEVVFSYGWSSVSTIFPK